MTIRFGDTDPAGLVYYPNIYHYWHVAMEEFFAGQCGISYHRLVKEERIGFPTVQIQTQFSHPLFYGDEVEILISIAQIGRSSLTLDYELMRVGDNTICAASKQVHVAMDLDTRRPVDIPQFLRDRLTET
jgi:4-hydroxybenzoyl-CoA thioesterase